MKVEFWRKLTNEEKWNKAAEFVLENERVKRGDPQWVPTFHNGAYNFTKKVKELLK